MTIFIFLFGILTAPNARAAESSLANQVRASCLKAGPQLQDSKVVVAAKLDCLYQLAIKMAGGPATPLMDPKFAQTRQQLSGVRDELKKQSPQTLDELLLLRALRELTLPTYLPPIADPAHLTLEQLRVAHENIFARMPLVR